MASPLLPLKRKGYQTPDDEISDTLDYIIRQLIANLDGVDIYILATHNPITDQQHGAASEDTMPYNSAQDDDSASDSGYTLPYDAVQT